MTIEATDAFCADEYNEQLRNRSLDVVFARPAFDTTCLDVVPLFHERLVAVVSGDSPLAARKTLRIQDLASEPLLLFDRHVMPVLFDKVLDLYAKAGLAPKTIPTPGAGPHNHAGLMSVASGNGVYVCIGIPQTSPEPVSGVAVVPLSNRMPRSTSAWRGARAKRRRRSSSSSTACGRFFRRRDRASREHLPGIVKTPSHCKLKGSLNSLCNLNTNPAMLQPVSRVVDLLDPDLNRISNMTVDEARRRVLSADPAAVRAIDGSFALVAAEGQTVRLARSMDRPMRYFLAKRHEGPGAVRGRSHRHAASGAGRTGRASRISSIRATRAWSRRTTSSISRSSAVRIPIRPTRGSSIRRAARSPPISTRSAAATSARWPDEIAKWLSCPRRGLSPAAEPIGVAFSGGIDSGAVFLVTYHTMLRLGMSPSRLKAFVLNLGDGPDVEQARAFLSAVGLSLFLEEIDAKPEDLDACETVRVLEDYKPLDVECAAMGLRLCRGIRERYPEWRHLVDGDGGDENLKDYPIEENPELTIRSVVDNLMLYQEGWGVGRIKHSLTYSGGLSRSYVRTYAPARRYGFDGFSPYTCPERDRGGRRHPVRRASPATTCRRSTR